MKQLSFFFFSLFAVYSMHAQTMQDTTAIKKLLEKESMTWRSGDVKAHSDCWQIRSYSKIIVSTAEGKALSIPPTVMVSPPAGVIGKGGNSVNSNYSFSIYGNAAWVYHDEVSTTTDSTKSYTHEIRMLEKINGKWKLVAQSIHAYVPSQ